MEKGIIVKGIGGFYYIKKGNEVFECKARGKFRSKRIIPLVGDYVLFSYDETTKQGVIEDILDRKIELIRPPVANVEQAIIVFSLKNPDPNIKLLDKILVMSEYHNLELKICINKIDLDNEKLLYEIIGIYKNTGYEVILCSTKKDIGIDRIKEVLKNKISVFAGPSGVGKSSILNKVQSGLKLKTGEISSKIKRGKHTTRHSELLQLDFGGWVVDSPGFTSLDIGYIDPEELGFLFPEFKQYMDHCKFTNCLHVNEPNCGVKNALKTGYISKERYNNYVDFLEQIKEINNRRY
ncbi:ribosome small subunit-dependent GTPase A [Paramaledivibacter caminithermalis]|jgi:ribosome biogenesis GTPase|uniref:Small ribosomal subunit biogenesis GTPase RsgA n=1 Tax=Paramaledivibacter caminithermalis (strain DSM 15212 / CIP 107654 / DViRD3) TaxID=1121301 RepID=A0A1M6NHN1_PARC5|nr:ribosome small subunit-dependent GTPase A [Paramaledivibacter caminithermalis]SHJ95225.1 ribosome biogenesis GTPase [Paramaledivibacter caminithermalis DSM 15212]